MTRRARGARSARRASRPTHARARACAGARRRRTLPAWGLAGGWAFMLGRGGGPSGTGLWSATVTFLSVWAAHFTLARHVVYLIEGPSGVCGDITLSRLFSGAASLDDIAKCLNRFAEREQRGALAASAVPPAPHAITRRRRVPQHATPSRTVLRSGLRSAVPYAYARSPRVVSHNTCHLCAGVCELAATWASSTSPRTNTRST